LNRVTPPPEARPLDTFARCAGFTASRPFRQGGKESVCAKNVALANLNANFSGVQNMAGKDKNDLLVWGSAILASVVAIAGLARVYFGSGIDQRLGTTTLTYFAVAGALLMLRWIKSLSFGDTKFELRDLEERTAQASGKPIL